MKAFARITLLAAILIQGGCAHTSREVCSARLPELDERVESALTVLRAWNSEKVAARDPASETTAWGPSISTLSPALSDDDRASWRRWAEARLVETQRYIDMMRADAKGGDTVRASARHGLNEVADNLVAFDGYASRSLLPKMILSLERIRFRSQEIQSQACGSIDWR